MELTKNQFGIFNEEVVNVFTLKNDNGMEVSCMNYGCIITKNTTSTKHTFTTIS